MNFVTFEYRNSLCIMYITTTSVIKDVTTSLYFYLISNLTFLKSIETYSVRCFVAACEKKKSDDEVLLFLYLGTSTSKPFAQSLL